MPKILIVDDLESERHLAQQHLGRLDDIEFDFAESGTNAIERIVESEPDLVLTDLQMPEMDGLQLVREVKFQFPHIPVVLITAHGNELIAVEALRSGASSYVPKSHLADRLLPTVEEILALAQAERVGGRLIESLDGADFDFTLSNDPEFIPELVDLLQNMVEGVGLCDGTDRLRLGIALEEALLNSLYHGNLEIGSGEIEQAKANLLDKKSLPLAEQRRGQSPYRERRIKVRAEISSQDARFVIRDEGSGFDLDSLPDPSSIGGMDRASGRGILLMQSFMDEVAFQKNGTEVIMIKRRDPALSPPTSVTESRREAVFFTEKRDDTLVLSPLKNIGSLAESCIQDDLTYILDQIVEPSVRNVVIDFSRVGYIGSSMLEAMRVLRKQAVQAGGDTAACNVPLLVREVLAIARFHGPWPIHRSIDEALGSISANANVLGFDASDFDATAETKIHNSQDAD